MTAVLPAALTQRPMTPEDAARWAELLAACEAVDRRGENYDAEDCAEELTDPDVDLAADSRLVLDGDRAVGYQVLHLDAGAHRLVHADAAVHPEHRGRGIGSALLAEARRWAAQRDARVTMRVPENHAGAVELAAGAGLRPARWWSEMRRDLAAPVAAASLPVGLTAHPLGPDYDSAAWDELLRTAHNAAFAEHWGSAPVTAEAWAHSRSGNRNLRPGASVAAGTAAGEVAGYVMSYEFDADTTSTGVRDLYVASVGTAREWRGRGVASALLAHVLATAAAAGFEQSSLTVDTQNPTGALGVYSRAGYALHRREVSYTDV